MDENVKILRIDTGDSEQSVKDLKEEIKDLRDAILNLEEGTDDYSKAVKKLQDDQRKLDKVMSLSKKGAVALDGSYDSLVHKMALLKKEWKATNDEAKRDELGKQIGNINNELKELDAQIGNYQRNVGDYSNQICDAFEKMQQEISEYENKAAQAYQTGDAKAYADAISEIGKRQTVIDQINQDSDMMNGTLEKRMEGLTSLASGIAGGFSAIQGVMALCGTESEEFEKIMVKLTAAMAIVQGVAGIAGMIKGIKSLISTIKALKVALVSFSSSNPVTLIITLVAALGSAIYAMTAFGDETDEATDATSKLADETKRLADEEQRYQSLFSRAKSIKAALDRRDILAGTKTEQQVLEENFSIAYDEALRLIGKAEEAKNKLKETYSNLGVPDFLVNIRKQLSDGSIEEYSGDDFINMIEDRWPSVIAFEDQLTDVKEEYLSALEAAGEAKVEYYNALAEVQIYEIKKAQEAAQAAEDEANRIMAATENAHKALQEFREELSNEIEKDNEIEIIPEIKIDPKEGQGVVKKEYDVQIASNELEKRKELNDAVLLSTEERAARELEIEKEFNQEKLDLINENIEKALGEGDITSAADLIQERADLEIEIEKQKNEELARLREEDAANQKLKAQQAMDITSATAKTMASLFQGAEQIWTAALDAQLKNGKISEKEYKRQMEKVKGIQIAQATISTLAASVDAFRSMAGIPIVGPALGGAAAAAAIAMGIAQIIKIKNTDVSGTGSTPDLGGGVGNVQPNTDIISQDFKPVDTHNVTGNKETEELNKGTRVYILESDLEESGRRVKVRDEETSF